MAATEDPRPRAWGPVVAAALALPGVAAAQNEPGPGLISFKWLSYQDSQPGLQRIRVQAPALYLRAPIGSRWGVEGSLTTDSVSGATPRWHTAISSASRMVDKRHAGDVKVTRYDDRSSWSLGLAASDEDDFSSRAISAHGRWNSEDNNRSWNAGVALTHDRIGSTNDPTLDESRRTFEATAGVTHALTRSDLVQLSLTHAQGRGYFSDPYRLPDVRPASRHQTNALLRWNHHFEQPDISLRSSWRSYRDSFGVRSHTLVLEPVFTATERITITPSLRLYSQSAARFYYDPVYSFQGAPYPPGYFESPPRALSADQRLAAFGAATLGLKVTWRTGDQWTTDIKFERYEQRSSWRVGGTGSPGLAPFSARFVQWGLARTF